MKVKQVLISLIIFCILSINVYAIDAKYKEWVIGANPNAGGYLYPKKNRSGPKKYNYNIKGLKIKKFFHYEKQGSLGGINLGWTSNASAKTGKKRALWYFTRKSNAKGPIKYGEPLAIAWNKAGYILYGKRNNGINLKWSKNPHYQWKIFGGKNGSPVQRAKDRVIIYNTKHKHPLIYYKRKMAGHIGWPDSCDIGGCTAIKVKKTVGKVGQAAWDLGKWTLKEIHEELKRMTAVCYGRPDCLYSKIRGDSSGPDPVAPIDSVAYLLTCMRYIEMNPVRATMVKHPGEYRWSSYSVNAQEAKVSLLIQAHPIYKQLGSDKTNRQYSYRELFKNYIDKNELNEIRKALNQELVLGRDDFKDKIERMTNRQTRAGQSGRPIIEESGAIYYVF